MDFNNNFYYHIYNRGVDKREVFLDKWDYRRFLDSLREFNQIEPIGSLYYYKRNLDKTYKTSDVFERHRMSESALVYIIAYCLNPNHYHLLVQQRIDSGISKLMMKLGNGYTKYFNEKYNRSGSLFQGKYKVKEVKSTYGLIKLSVYVNCNAEIHNIAKKEEWPWSSYQKYISVVSNTNRCLEQQTKEVLSEFKNIEEYKNFCEELLPDIKAIKNLEKYGLE